MRTTAPVNLAMVFVVLLFLAFNFFAFRAADEGSSCYGKPQSALSRPVETSIALGMLPFLLREEAPQVVMSRRRGRNFRDRTYGLRKA